jgi:hypothetical protein
MRSFCSMHTKSVRLATTFLRFWLINGGIPLALVQSRILIMANEQPQRDATLRYLDADQVTHPSGSLAGVTVCNPDDQAIGAISGVLVEPASRRVRYFVVERRVALLHRRYVLAADTPAVLEADDQKLRTLSNVDDLERFDARRVERFSEEDAITAMFSQPAA